MGKWRYLAQCLRNRLHIMQIRSRSQYDEKRRQYMLTRSLHGLEKGLCLPETRLGFGIQRIEKLCQDLETYYAKRYDPKHPAIGMALGALNAYFVYHEERGYENEEVLRSKACFERVRALFQDVHMQGLGGFLRIQRADIATVSPEAFHKLISTRHSVRNFDKKPVPMEMIQAAVSDAMLCPSACNRQPTRVYVVPKEKHSLLLDDLKGIGGFSEYADKYLVLTGDISAFDSNEDEQWIVNAGIFAGYLTLALHARGIASCAIQRALHWSTAIERTQARLGIPPNEQIVMLLGLGMYPEQMCVPVSHRYETSMIIKEL